MAGNRLELVQKKSNLILFLIVITSLIAIITNFFALVLANENSLFYLLFYIPIILTAYSYPRRGSLISIGYAVLFLAMVMATSHESHEIVIASLGHAGIFIVIGFVVSYLAMYFSHEQRIHDRLVEIVESSSDAIIGKTLDGIITDWNKSAERLYGYSAAEVIGKPIAVLLPPDRPDDIRYLLDKIRKGESIERYETVRMTKGGRRIDVSLSISPIKNHRGKIIGASTIAHDISERKRMEDTLTQSERKYRELVELLPQTIFEIDRNGTIISANSVALNMFGYEKEDLEKGIKAFFVFSPVDHTRLGENIRRILQGEHLGGTSYTAQRKDGTVFPVIVYSNVILDRNVPVGLRGVLIDVTELKKTQDALAESGQRINFSLEAAEIGVWELDLVKHTAWRSLRHDQIFGYEELLPEWTYEMFLHHVLPEDRSMVETKFGQALENFSDWEFESRIRRKDGAICWIWAKGRPEFNDLHGPKKMFGLVQDITERKQAEKALELANKKLQLLNSITRHDILNQITTLNIYHSLTEGMVDDKETLSFLQNAKKAADTISRQISFTQEYQDIGVKTPAWQNVHTLFLNAASSFNTTSVIIEPCEKNIEIYADPLLEKVFYNLIDNSLRYGEKLTRIRITHRVDEEELTLVYEDDGIGIPMEAKQKIFHKGFGKNTGLGLFLAREILAITSITITENGEPGKGVRFGILVPEDMYRLTGATKPLS